MGLFGKRQPDPVIAPDRVIALEAEVRALKRDLSEIEDKVFRWMKRSDKRSRVDAAEASPDLMEAGNPDSGTGPASGDVSLPEPIRRLLARRSGRRNGVPPRIPVSG